MSVNWIIVIAQIINFLILVWLLKRFLYGPILQAMDKRQKHLAELQEAANKKSAEAEEITQAYTTLTADLENEKHQIFSNTKASAEEERQKFLEKAKEEVERIKQGWIRSMQREQSAFLQQGRVLIGQEACQLARTVLHDLADTDLEKAILAVFMKKLHDVSQEQRQQIREGTERDAAPARVHSSFELENTQKEQLADVFLHELQITTPIEFVVSDRSMAGIELDVSGYHFGWSIEEYMHDLEQSLQRYIERASPPPEQGHD
ncbi:hypothetical protein [uncultured Desulfobulbus sp.]|uniref:F0F1 ATP synthase subunit B family protein n=1 Tax=uncultured Desulfobulbus sp. TaxID=239745 RepID=UPI0029C87D5D|nr:hypothetical protein [uncultured Desulfobulbus sp.]